MSHKNTLQTQVESLAAKLSQMEFVDVDVAKHQRCSNYLCSKIKFSDEALTPDVLFANCSSQLTIAIEKLDKFIQEKNLDFLNQALENLQNAVSLANQFIVVFGEAGGNYYGDTLNQFSVQIGTLTKTLSALNDDVVGVADANKKQLENLVRQFDALVDGDPKIPTAGWSMQIANALAQLEQRFSEELYGKEVGKEGVLTKSNKIYSQLEAILAEGVNLGKIIEVDGKTKKQRSDEALSYLQRLKESSNDVLGKIGLGATVGGYQRRANQEAAMSLFWTTLILATIVGVFCMNYEMMSFLVEHVGDTNFSSIILIRVLFAIPFISFMVYAGIKAKNHRKMELRYRQFDLELAAFEPNLPNLDESMRSLAKLAFIQKTFGRFDEDDKDLELPSLEKLKELADVFKVGKQDKPKTDSE